jgi:hypothetical protein
MSLKFWGNYRELQSVLSLPDDLDGYWHELKNNRYQYRTVSGGIVTWWQKTGTITLQGDPAAREKLKRVFTGTNE